MQWWVWLLLGVGLLMVELLTPGGFFCIFFALSALIVGALAGFGVGGPLWVQWTLFSVFSVASLLLFRARLLEKFRPKGEPAAAMNDVVGGAVIVVEDLAPDGLGKADFRGTRWTVRNIGTAALKAGQRGRIEKLDGLTLFVKAETP